MVPEVIFAKPEVTCFESQVIFITGNDIYGSESKIGVTGSEFYDTGNN